MGSSEGGSSAANGVGVEGGRGDDSAVSDLMERPHLTVEELEFTTFSDDEDDEKATCMEVAGRTPPLLGHR